MEQIPTDAIRQAVASGDFLRATNLWNDYATALLHAISSGVCTQADMDEARELLKWSRETISLARTHTQCRLDGLHAVEQYLQTAPQSAVLLRTRL